MNLLERLKDRAQKVKTDLDAERAKDKRHKLERERIRTNELAPYYKRDGAWCARCNQDYSVLYTKHGSDLLAYYLGTCSKGHTVRREITLRDRYFDQSRMVRELAERHADDLLTPNDARFKYVYPDKWRELERERELRSSHNTARGV